MLHLCRNEQKKMPPKEVLQITLETVDGRPATVSWDRALLEAVRNETDRQEIIRLIGLEEMHDETRDFFVCFRQTGTDFDWLRCVSSFSGETGLRHFSLTFTKYDDSETLDVDDFCRWCAETAGCEPELSDRRLGQYRRYREQQKGTHK